MYSTLSSEVIFTCRSFPQQSLCVLDVHINGMRGITNHITEYKIHISYSENHDSTLLFYYFYISSLPTPAHTIAKGSIFFVQFLFLFYKITKIIVFMSHRLAAFRSQCQWTRIFISLSKPMAMGDSTLI